MYPLNASEKLWAMGEFVLGVVCKELMFEGNCSRKVLVSTCVQV